MNDAHIQFRGSLTIAVSLSSLGSLGVDSAADLSFTSVLTPATDPEHHEKVSAIVLEPQLDSVIGLPKSQGKPR